MYLDISPLTLLYHVITWLAITSLFLIAFNYKPWDSDITYLQNQITSAEPVYTYENIIFSNSNATNKRYTMVSDQIFETSVRFSPLTSTQKTSVGSGTAGISVFLPTSFQLNNEIETNHFSCSFTNLSGKPITIKSPDTDLNIFTVDATDGTSDGIDILIPTATIAIDGTITYLAGSVINLEFYFGGLNTMDSTKDQFDNVYVIITTLA